MPCSLQDSFLASVWEPGTEKKNKYVYSWDYYPVLTYFIAHKKTIFVPYSFTGCASIHTRTIQLDNFIMETDNAKTQAQYLFTLSLFLGCFTVSWFTRYPTDTLTLLFAKRYVSLSRTLIKSPPTVITLNIIWQQKKDDLPSWKAAQN